MTTLATGARIGRFVITGVLGEGRMSVVYEARDPELDRTVAVKVLRGGLGELASSRLAREAQTLARLSHPNVVAVHDVGVEGGCSYLAMERVDGETLDAWLARTRPTPHAIVAAFVQAGRGLAAAHARQLVHRDLKPSNILVDRDGRVRVTDFGLAPHADDDEGATVDVPWTATGTVVGTPRYMAPEQRNAIASAKSDQYSFCVALWEAVVSELPSSDSSAARRPPRWLRRALARGIAPDPAARHESMNALLAILEGAAKRRRWRALAAGGIALAGAAIAAGLAMAPSHRIECERAGDGVLAVWNAGAAARMHTVLLKTGPHGAELATQVAAELDGWAGRWRDARVDACRATHERGEQSAEILDRIGICLDDQLAYVRALLVRLARADGGAADHAFDAVQALPPTASCNSARVAGAPAPDERTIEAKRQLDDARAAFALYDDLAAERAAIAAADTTSPTVRAQALALEAYLVGPRDDARSLALFEEALTDAADGGDRDVALYVASNYLLHVSDGGDQARIEVLLPIQRAAAIAAGPKSPHQRLAAEAAATALGALGRHSEANGACAEITDSEPTLVHAVRASDLGGELKGLSPHRAADHPIETAGIYDDAVLGVCADVQHDGD